MNNFFKNILKHTEKKESFFYNAPAAEKDTMLLRWRNPPNESSNVAQYLSDQVFIF